MRSYFLVTTCGTYTSLSSTCCADFFNSLYTQTGMCSSLSLPQKRMPVNNMCNAYRYRCTPKKATVR